MARALCILSSFRGQFPCKRSLVATPRPSARPSVTRRLTMAPKRKQAESAASSLPWASAAAVRLDAYRAVHDEMAAKAAGGPPGKGAWSSRWGGPPGRGGGCAAEPTAAAQPTASGTQRVIPPTGPAAAGVAPPTALPQTPEEEMKALRFSRHAPLGFAAAHKAVMIAGRPVVVPPTKMSRESSCARCVCRFSRDALRAGGGGCPVRCRGPRRNGRSCEPTARGRAVCARTSQ